MKYIIADYGMGNLHSVKNAFEYLGKDAEISSDYNTISLAEAIILPGVGAFPDAVKALREKDLFSLLQKKAKQDKVPFLGICLGMQLLLSKSYEFKECEGLDLISGSCVKITAENLKIPHIGWNDLFHEKKDSPLIADIKENSFVYFVHSFRAELKDKNNLVSYTVYGEQIPAIIQNGNVFGCQFHPEKSEKTGLKIIENFCNYCENRLS